MSTGRRHAHVFGLERRTDDERFSFGPGKVNALAGFTGAVGLAVNGFSMVVLRGRHGDPRSPDDYKRILPVDIGVAHVTVEVSKSAV